jgi:hypothetical protein
VLGVDAPHAVRNKEVRYRSFGFAVTSAFGRDFGEVSPLKGVIHTESTKQDLHVSVDAAPREAAR